MTEREMELCSCDFDYLLLFIQKGLREFYEMRNCDDIVEYVLDILNSIYNGAMKKGILIEDLESVVKVLTVTNVFNKLRRGLIV